jgi:hypothetical protein
LRALAAASIAALLSGGGAMAAPAPAIVAQLVTQVCMPMIERGAMNPDDLPPGGRKLSQKERIQLDRGDDLATWLYQADDDFVVIGVRVDDCSVATGATGSPDFLATLRRAVTTRYSAPDTIDLQPPNPAPDLGYITYWVDLPRGGPQDRPPAEALAITYSKATAGADKRTFFVGVFAARQKPN